MTRGSGDARKALVLLGLVALGCEVAIGAGAAAVLAGGAVLGSECYAFAQLTLRDEGSGEPRCDAEVVAIDSEGSEVAFTPCYHAPLTPGRWRIAARLPGRPAVETTLELREPDGPCGKAVHTVELTTRGPLAKVAVAPPIELPPAPAVPTASEPAPAESAKPPLAREPEWAPGAVVTLRGRVSTLPHQHIMTSIEGKRSEYFDREHGSQTVIYVSAPIECPGFVDVRGVVVEVRAGSKRPGEETKAEDDYAALQLDVIGWTCVEGVP